MRTTLDIEDDLLAAAKALARRERVSASQVVSRLLREALTGRELTGPEPAARTVCGFRPFTHPGARRVTNALIDQLRDREGI